METSLTISRHYYSRCFSKPACSKFASYPILQLRLELTTGNLLPPPHQALMALVEDNSDPAIVRKTTLLLGEVLKLASRLLPSTYSARMQLLPDLFQSATKFGIDGRFAASSAVYQIDSLNRTLHRSLANQTAQHASVDDEKRGQRQVEQVKLKINMTIDEKHFSQLIVDSGVGSCLVCYIALAQTGWLMSTGLGHEELHQVELGVST